MATPSGLCKRAASGSLDSASEASLSSHSRNFPMTILQHSQRIEPPPSVFLVREKESEDTETNPAPKRSAQTQLTSKLEVK